MSYQPVSLERCAGRVVNTCLQNYYDSYDLPIPRRLKRELHLYFVEDNIYNPNWKPTQYQKDMLHNISFRIPFMRLTPTQFLTLMNLNERDTIPFNLNQCNIVTSVWYEIPDMLECYKYCDICSRDFTRREMHRSWDILNPAEVLEDVLQLRSNWCYRCNTTALFKVSEHPWEGAFQELFRDSSEDSSD